MSARMVDITTGRCQMFGWIVERTVSATMHSSTAMNVPLVSGHPP